MVKHMIIWKMKSDLENKEESAKKIKTELDNRKKEWEKNNSIEQISRSGSS